MWGTEMNVYALTIETPANSLPDSSLSHGTLLLIQQGLAHLTDLWSLHRPLPPPLKGIFFIFCVPLVLSSPTNIYQDARRYTRSPWLYSNKRNNTHFVPGTH
jgi:hypothetical protein